MALKAGKWPGWGAIGQAVREIPCLYDVIPACGGVFARSVYSFASRSILSGLCEGKGT